MLLLIFVAFIAGLVTAVSPCVLPILPIVLAAGAGDDRRRPYLVIAGLIASFSFFTLASVQIIDALHLPPSLLRDVAIAVIAVFGLTLLVPALAARFERATAALPGIGEGVARSGRLGGLGGFVTGVGLGLVWTPCAGPILGAVTSLAVTAPGSFSVLLLVVSYAIGAGLPLLAIAIGGRAALAKLRLRAAAGWAGRALGVLVLVTAGLMAVGADTAISNALTSSLPNWTGTLQTLERADPVKQALFGLGVGRAPATSGKPGTVGGSGRQSGLPVGPAAPEFAAGNWLNSKPLTMAGLKGKVVLVDFWTYSCINCIRSLPFVEGWYQKYASQGLVIVGVHTPEFAFEHDTGNVSAAIARLGITYPVLQDNDFATWTAFSNSYWPADYLIDANGNLRSSHFGEGDYVQTEAEIRSLLDEAGTAAALPSPAESAPAPPFADTQTPETYIGTDRASSFASPERTANGQVATYTIPSNLNDNTFAVSGPWDFEPQYAAAAAGGNRLQLNFSARDVYLVMSADKPTTVTVTVSGIGTTIVAAGTEDVAADGTMTVSEARLYHLVHLPALAHGLVTITFSAPGVRAYAFTFGG
jgi:cytochrome c biogenesis protein CcdA/thiol-disulfide isomerase/thioredoxin